MKKLFLLFTMLNAGAFAEQLNLLSADVDTSGVNKTVISFKLQADVVEFPDLGFASVSNPRFVANKTIYEQTSFNIGLGGYATEYLCKKLGYTSYKKTDVSTVDKFNGKYFLYVNKREENFILDFDTVSIEDYYTKFYCNI